MATETKYRPEYVGDWGMPTPAPGCDYSTETLAMSDGTNIFFRSWRTADASAPTLVLLHGLGAHTGWFIDMGNELNARGLNVYMDDHRGFGRSGGPRGHVRQGRIYLDDITRFLDEVRQRQPGAPIFVLGHSMGGIFAIHLAAMEARSGRRRLAGLILVNPWVADPTKPTLSLAFNVFALGALGSSRGLAAAGGHESMTVNPEAIALLDDDTYWVRSESSSFFFQLVKLRSAFLKQAHDVRLPALIMQCEQDKAVVPAATRRAYEALGSADKTWKTYPRFAHDFEFEPERSILDDDIADWILRHRS